MNKENYIEIINEKIKNKNSKQIMINQINNYYDSKANYKKKKHAKHLALSTKKLIFAFECSLTQ